MGERGVTVGPACLPVSGCEVPAIAAPVFGDVQQNETLVRCAPSCRWVGSASTGGGHVQGYLLPLVIVSEECCTTVVMQGIIKQWIYWSSDSLRYLLEISLASNS